MWCELQITSAEKCNLCNPSLSTNFQGPPFNGKPEPAVPIAAKIIRKVNYLLEPCSNSSSTGTPCRRTAARLSSSSCCCWHPFLRPPSSHTHTSVSCSDHGVCRRVRIFLLHHNNTRTPVAGATDTPLFRSNDDHFPSHPPWKNQQLRRCCFVSRNSPNAVGYPTFFVFLTRNADMVHTTNHRKHVAREFGRFNGASRKVWRACVRLRGPMGWREMACDIWRAGVELAALFPEVNKKTEKMLSVFVMLRQCGIVEFLFRLTTCLILF